MGVVAGFAFQLQPRFDRCLTHFCRIKDAPPHRSAIAKLSHPPPPPASKYLHLGLRLPRHQIVIRTLSTATSPFPSCKMICRRSTSSVILLAIIAMAAVARPAQAFCVYNTGSKSSATFLAWPVSGQTFK